MNVKHCAENFSCRIIETPQIIYEVGDHFLNIVDRETKSLKKLAKVIYQVSGQNLNCKNKLILVYISLFQ